MPRRKAKPFERKYAGEQRQAIFKARFDQHQTYEEITERANSGDLTGEPFPITWQYLGQLCREEEQRRRGRFDSNLGEMPHRDAIEELRRGCIGVAEDLLVDLRAISTKKPGNVDPRRLQEAIKAVALAASIPARDEPAPAAAKTPQVRPRRVNPGNFEPGNQAKPPTRTGTLMRAHRATLERERAGEATEA